MINIYSGSSIFSVNKIEMIERSDDKVQLIAIEPNGNNVSLTGVISDDYAFEILDELIRRANLNRIVDFERVLEGVCKSGKNKAISTKQQPMRRK